MFAAHHSHETRAFSKHSAEYTTRDFKIIFLLFSNSSFIFTRTIKMPRVQGIGKRKKFKHYSRSEKRVVKENSQNIVKKKEVNFDLQDENVSEKETAHTMSNKIAELLLAAAVLEDKCSSTQPSIQPPRIPLQTVGVGTNSLSSTDNNARWQPSCDLLSLKESANHYAHLWGWVSTLKEDALIFSKVETPCGTATVSRSVKVQSDLSWTVSIHGQTLRKDNKVISAIPGNLDPSLKVLLTIVENSSVCAGNPDRFNAVGQRRYGPRFVVKGTNNYEEQGYEVKDKRTGAVYTRTILSKNCYLLVTAEQNRCEECKKARNVLRAKESRENRVGQGQKSARLAHDSRTPYKHLCPDEMRKRLQNAQAEKRKAKAKLEEMEKKMKEFIEQDGVKVDADLHKELKRTVTDSRPTEFEPGTFKYLFWEQQKKMASVFDARAMCWHPLMIKWCLSLKQLSSSAYSFLRSSGMMDLPSERTLYDFSHWTEAETGVSCSILEKLLDELGKEDWQLNVGIVVDEMKIKSDLVYSKSSGELVGFVNMGDFNNQMETFQQRCSSDGEQKEPQLATHVLVLMVRGLLTKLKFPFAHYSTVGFTSAQLFPCIWEGVMVLESLGLKVRSITADGASPNRKFFRLHRAPDLPDGTPVYKTKNVFAEESRDIYFICDPPHLVKTVRNCWEKSHNGQSKRKMKNEGMDISWQHLVTLYERDVGINRNAPGLRLVPKLKYDHVHLNSFLRMRVNLAAQVLSLSVANALQFVGNNHTRGTEKFIRMIDSFFDCMNVKNTVEGVRSRKAFKLPYKDPEDTRFKWLTDTFLVYLDNWEASIARDFSDLPKEQRNRMCLSRETLEGLRITVHSFVELGKILLQIPGVKMLLSEKFCQDPLEEYFAKQRRCGGCNDNPTYSQFHHNYLALHVAGPSALSSEYT